MNQNVKYTKVKLVNLSINDEFGIYQSGGKKLTDEQIIEKIFTIGIIPFLRNKYKTIDQLSKDPTKLTQIKEDSNFKELLKQYNEFLEDLKYNEEARRQLINNLFLFEINYGERIAIFRLLNKCCGILSKRVRLPKTKIINEFEKLEALKQKDTYKRYKLYLIESINDYLENKKKFNFGWNQKVDPKPADHGVGAINESLYHNKRILKLLAEEGRDIYDKYNIEKRRASLLKQSKITIDWESDWYGIKYNFKNYIKRGDSIDTVNAKKETKKRLANNTNERRNIIAKQKLKLSALTAFKSGSQSGSQTDNKISTSIQNENTLALNANKSKSQTDNKISKSNQNENTHYKQVIETSMKSLNNNFDEDTAEALVNFIKLILDNDSLSESDKKEHEDKLYMLQFNRIMRV